MIPEVRVSLLVTVNSDSKNEVDRVAWIMHVGIMSLNKNEQKNKFILGYS
jgi:hypothetical protein